MEITPIATTTRRKSQSIGEERQDDALAPTSTGCPPGSQSRPWERRYGRRQRPGVERPAGQTRWRRRTSQAELPGEGMYCAASRMKVPVLELSHQWPAVSEDGHCSRSGKPQMPRKSTAISRGSPSMPISRSKKRQRTAHTASRPLSARRWFRKEDHWHAGPWGCGDAEDNGTCTADWTGPRPCRSRTKGRWEDRQHKAITTAPYFVGFGAAGLRYTHTARLGHHRHTNDVDERTVNASAFGKSGWAQGGRCSSGQPGATFAPYPSGSCAPRCRPLRSARRSVNGAVNKMWVSIERPELQRGPGPASRRYPTSGSMIQTSSKRYRQVNSRSTFLMMAQL